MNEFRKHYEDRYSAKDPYDCGNPKNRFWLQLALGKLRLVQRITRHWYVRRALDAGCGDWGILYQVPSLVGKQLAVAGDISLIGVRKAREHARTPDIQYVVFSVSHLPFRTDTFDFIHCSEVIEHTENATKTVDELTRVGTLGARYIMTVPNEKLVGKLEAEHLQTFGYDDFYQLIQRSGLSVKRIYGVYLVLRHLAYAETLFSWFGVASMRILLRLGEWCPRRGIQVLVVARKRQEGWYMQDHSTEKKIVIEDIMNDIRKRVRERQTQDITAGVMKADPFDRDGSHTRSAEANVYRFIYEARAHAANIRVPLSMAARNPSPMNRLLDRLRRGFHNLVVYYLSLLADRQITFNQAAVGTMASLLEKLEIAEDRIAELEQEVTAMRQQLTPPPREIETRPAERIIGASDMR